MHADEKIRPVVDSFRYKHEIAGLSLLLITAVLFLPGIAHSGGLPFKSGEKLTYDARWLWFDAGRVVTEISSVEGDPDGRLLRFTLHTTTIGFVAKLFQMDDHFESVWDTKAMVPRTFSVKIRESTAKKDLKLDFNHEGGKVTVIKDDNDPEVMDLSAGAQCFLSAGHFTRTRKLVPKKSIRFPVFEDNKNYDAVVKVLRKERIKVLGGLVDTVKINPKIKYEGAFQSKGDLYVWMTDDEYKVPVKLRINILVGEFTFNLLEAKGANIKIIPIEKKK